MQPRRLWLIDLNDNKVSPTKQMIVGYMIEYISNISGVGAIDATYRELVNIIEPKE